MKLLRRPLLSRPPQLWLFCSIAAAGRRGIASAGEITCPWPRPTANRIRLTNAGTGIARRPIPMVIVAAEAGGPRSSMKAGPGRLDSHLLTPTRPRQEHARISQTIAGGSEMICLPLDLPAPEERGLRYFGVGFSAFDGY